MGLVIISSSHSLLKMEWSEKIKWHDKLVLAQLPHEQAKTIACTIIDSLYDSDLKYRLANDADIKFTIQGILFGLHIVEPDKPENTAQRALMIINRWLIPQGETPLLDNENYNKYLRMFLNVFPVIYLDDPECNSAIAQQQAPTLIGKFISQFNDKNCPPPQNLRLNEETTHVAYNAILNCIENINENGNPETTLSTRLFYLSLISNLPNSNIRYEDAEQIMNRFLNVCFSKNKVSGAMSPQYIKTWFVLHQCICEQILDSSNDYKIDYLMKLFSYTKNQSTLINNLMAAEGLSGDIKAKYFYNTLDLMKKKIKLSTQNSLIVPLYPCDSFLNVFSDEVFIKEILNSPDISLHISKIFSFFSKGYFKPNSKWQNVFINYINYMLKNTNLTNAFVITYSIFLHGSNFVAHYPRLSLRFLPALLKACALIGNIPERLSLYKNIDKDYWITMFSNLLEFARADENSMFESQLIALITKFINSNIPQTEDYTIHSMLLILLLRDDNTFYQKVTSIFAQHNENQSQRSEYFYDFALFCVLFSPYYLTSGRNPTSIWAFESILYWFQTNPKANDHIVSFMIFLIEASRNNPFHSSSINYNKQTIIYLKSKLKEKDFFSRLARLTFIAVLIPTITVEQAEKLEKSMKDIKRYIYNGLVLTFGKTEEKSQIKLIIRSPAGISSFEFNEVNVTHKEKPSEDDLKSNCVKFSDIDYHDMPPFPEIVMEKLQAQGGDDISLKLLLNLGLVENNKSQLYRIPDECSPKIADFDFMCNLIQFKIGVTRISKDSTDLVNKYSTSPRYEQLLSDLGKSFQTTLFEFVFEPFDFSQNLVIIFNETINPISKLYLQGHGTKNAITITHCKETLTQPGNMYRINFPLFDLKHLVLPFPRKQLIVRREMLSRIIATICYFYYGQPSSNVSELGKSLIENYTSRKNKLEEITRGIQIFEDVVSTIYPDSA